MESSDTTLSVSADVSAPVARAFTAEIGTWWDDDQHILAAPPAEMVFEPFVGGHIIDRGKDGSECCWARVLEYEPPHRVCSAGTSAPSGRSRPTPGQASEIEVTFTEVTPERTRAGLTHRHLDRHGDCWESMRRPAANAIIWEHGRRNMALAEAGLLSIVLPVTDDSDLSGIGVFAAPSGDVRAIMDDDPGVRAGIFTYEVHPVRGFPGAALP